MEELQALGLHPGQGTAAVALGERGSHHHRLEPAVLAEVTAASRADVELCLYRADKRSAWFRVAIQIRESAR